MPVARVIAPVLILIGLTFALLIWMGRERFAALRGDGLDGEGLALGRGRWPNRAALVANSFHNQLELPILFYVLVAFALITRNTDALFVWLEWLFVASRLAHAAVHVTTNTIAYRFAAYLVGVVVLVSMWVAFAIKVFETP